MGFVDVLKKPISDKKAFGIGTILMAIPIANIFTGLFLMPGYSLRIANKTMKNDKSLPEFSDFGKMVVDSLKVLIANFIYMIPLLIIAAILLGSALLQLFAAIIDPAKMASALMSLAGGMLILIPVAVIYSIMTVSAILNLAKKGNLGAAFALGEVIKNGYNLKFIGALVKAVAAGFVIMVIFMIASFIAILIPAIGPILVLIFSGAFSFSILVTTYTLLAEGYP